jgi:ubiquinone biosynthesis protein Coq4
MKGNRPLNTQEIDAQLKKIHLESLRQTPQYGLGVVTVID